MKKIINIVLILTLAIGIFAACAKKDTTNEATPDEATPDVTQEAEQDKVTINENLQEAAIKVAAIETAYGSEMWTKVCDAFTKKTGIKVELTTNKILEDVIGAQMKAGDYPRYNRRIKHDSSR